jgi:parallel beta-helix repeat protein
MVTSLPCCLIDKRNAIQITASERRYAMGKLLVALCTIIVLVSSAVEASTVWGFAFKEDETDHSGIGVRCLTCDLPHVTKYTDEDGYFGSWLAISGGRYHTFEYTCNGFETFQQIVWIPMLQTVKLPDVTMTKVGLEGELEGELGPGTFEVVGDLKVVEGSELTIRPATTLLFKGYYSLEVWGKMRALGVGTIEPVIFTHYYDHPDSMWGGIHFYGAHEDSRLQYCTIEYAMAKESVNSGCGGGVSLNYRPLKPCPVLVTHCTIRNCKSAASGAGLWVSAWNAVIEDCTIVDNEAGYTGGGVQFQQSHGCVIRDCVISGNTSNNGGGGICIMFSYPDVKRCTIENNTTGNYFDSGNGGGIYFMHSGSPTQGDHFDIIDCTIRNNYACMNGGGIALYWVCGLPNIEKCIITDNECYYNGGGVWSLFNSWHSISHCLIARNTCEEGVGGGLFLQEYGHPWITNCTLSDNDDNGGAAFVMYSKSSPIVNNSIFYGNKTGEILYDPSSHPTFTYCDIEKRKKTKPIRGEGNISCDPLFDEHYCLTWENYPMDDQTRSCCIDAGDPDSPLDPDGTRADIGYCYFDQSGSIIPPALSSAEPIKAQNFPNPFNPSTTISFELAKAGHVKLDIFNVNGALITTLADEAREAGRHDVLWNGKDAKGLSVASGVYFYRLEAGGEVQSKKMMLLR